MIVIREDMRPIWEGDTDRFSTNCGGSINTERKSNSLPHFLGFLALATLPVFWSTTAYVRSPTSPRSVTYEELSSSPNIDFTGYRHMETTLPGASFTDVHQLHVNSACFSYLSFLLKTAQKDLDINDPIQQINAMLRVLRSALDIERTSVRLGFRDQISDSLYPFVWN